MIFPIGATSAQVIWVFSISARTDSRYFLCSYYLHNSMIWLNASGKAELESQLLESFI